MDECKDCKHCEEVPQKANAKPIFLCWFNPVFCQDVGINNRVGEDQHACSKFEPKIP